MIITHGRGSNLLTYGYNFIVEFFINNKVKKVNINLHKGKVSINISRVVRCVSELKSINNINFNMLKNVKCHFTFQMLNKNIEVINVR